MITKEEYIRNMTGKIRSGVDGVRSILDEFEAQMSIGNIDAAHQEASHLRWLTRRIAYESEDLKEYLRHAGQP